jgi:hypothetical protein
MAMVGGFLGGFVGWLVGYRQGFKAAMVYATGIVKRLIR